MRRWLPFVLVIILIASLPLVSRASFFLDIFIMGVLYASVVLGLDLLMSYAGQISLGHGAFMAIGAYTSGLLTARFGASPLLAFGLAVLAAAVVSFVIGLPMLRLRGHYLAAGTLAFGLLVESLLSSLYLVTGGPTGLGGIPNFSLGLFRFDSAVKYYYLVWAIFGVLYWFTRNLINSHIGRASVAIHGDETVAGSLGVNVFLLKLQIFVVSAVYASIAGSIMAHYLRLIVPPQFGVIISIELLAMLLLGGAGSIVGGLLGALLWQFMPEVTQYWIDYKMALTGVIVIMLVILLPQGLYGLIFGRLKSIGG